MYATFFFKTTEDSLDKVQSWTMWRNYRASGSSLFSKTMYDKADTVPEASIT